LALGIGANAAMYSLTDQMLLRTLPVQAPEQLVNLSAPGPKPGSQSCTQAGNCETVFSYPMFRDLERAQKVFTALAAHRAFSVNVAYHHQTLNGRGLLVSGAYFPMLGLRPALGRLLSPADDQAIGASFVAVLSYSYWQVHLGADPRVLNQPITINGVPMTIVGVAPPGFDGTTLGSLPVVFVPITMRGALGGETSAFTRRRDYWVYLFGRVKPGVSLAQASSGLNGVYSSIINDVEARQQENMSAQTMKQFRAKKVLLEAGRRGQSSMNREART